MTYRNKAQERAVRVAQDNATARDERLRQILRDKLYIAVQGDAMFRVFSYADDRAITKSIDLIADTIDQEIQRHGEQINNV